MGRYGAGCRNSIDVYLPVASAEAAPRKAPVMLFCHGGVWAHGERWHYSPMAARLAQAGILTMVMSYSLYPKASAAMQAAEVNQALSWSLSNADKYGGDPAKVSMFALPARLHWQSCSDAFVSKAAQHLSGVTALQVSLMGHSAGAHLCTMALLHRAASAGRRLTEQYDQQPVDVRMPAAFVGIAGVYDISQHFDYERRRGVEVCAGAHPRSGPNFWVITDATSSEHET